MHLLQHGHVRKRHRGVSLRRVCRRHFPGEYRNVVCRRVQELHYRVVLAFGFGELLQLYSRDLPTFDRGLKLQHL